MSAPIRLVHYRKAKAPLWHDLAACVAAGVLLFTILLVAGLVGAHLP